jgi:hypothetical protein
MEKKPSSFFKFVPFERKDILENGLIRFTPIGEFNDPFELEPVITPISRNFFEYASNLSREELKNINFSDEEMKYFSERELKTEDYKNIYRRKIKNMAF